MKKVHFLVACCLVVCLALGGCAKDEPPLEAPAETDASPELPVEVEERPAEPEVPVEAPVEAEETPIEEIQADAEPHGIIVLIGTYGGWDSPKETFNVISINPNSGEVNTISAFSVPLHAFESNGESQNYFLTDVNSMFGNYRDMFSANFDKLALTLNATSGEMHAGWMDAGGNFIDATQALLPDSQSDFHELPRQAAIRFDGEYLVYDDGNDGDNTSYLKVSPDLSPDTIERYAIPNIIRRVDAHDVGITDWIDETNCLVSYYSLSQAYCEKCNTETKQLSSFIPETSRCNWSGVISPDGATVAFLSMSSSTSGDAEIFTVPLAGGDPIKVNLSSSLQSTYGDISMERQHGSQAEVYCYLLDWVE